MATSSPPSSSFLDCLISELQKGCSSLQLENQQLWQEVRKLRSNYSLTPAPTRMPTRQTSPFDEALCLPTVPSTLSKSPYHTPNFEGDLILPKVPESKEIEGFHSSGNFQMDTQKIVPKSLEDAALECMEDTSLGDVVPDLVAHQGSSLSPPLKEPGSERSLEEKPVIIKQGTLNIVVQDAPPQRGVLKSYSMGQLSNGTQNSGQRTSFSPSSSVRRDSSQLREHGHHSKEHDPHGEVMTQDSSYWSGGTSLAIALRDSWRDAQPPIGVGARKEKSFRGMHLRRNQARSGSVITTTSWLQPLVQRPSSRSRICWECFGVLLMLWDLIFLPLEAFDLNSAWLSVADMTTTIFWTLDLIASFLVGFQARGALEMRMSKIALRYLRTWFFPDVILAMINWLVFAIENGETPKFLTILRLGKLLRFARILRMVRLLRLFKVASTIEVLQKYLRSQTVLTFIGIMKLAGFLAGMVHGLACLWYTVGLSGEHTEQSWTTKASAASHDGDSKSYMYATSLHWVLTQFTPAGMEVVPTNATERYFNVGVVVLSILSFPSILGNITTLFNNLRQFKAEQLRQDLLLRRYLHENQISLELGNRVLGFFRRKQVGEMRVRIHETAIKDFNLLPESVRKALHAQVFTPHLLFHPFFAYFHDCDQEAMDMVCHLSIQEHTVLSGHDLYNRGKEATGMSVSMAGTLCVVSSNNESLVEDSKKLKVGSFICECALWLRWTHRQRVTTFDGPVEILVLDSARFSQVCQQTATFAHCSAYAKGYLEKFSSVFGDLEFGDGSVWFNLQTAVELTEVAFEGTPISASTRHHVRSLAGNSRSGSQWINEEPLGPLARTRKKVKKLLRC